MTADRRRYPPPVEEGDTAAVVSPSHAPPEAGLERGLERLRSFGVEPELFPTATRDTEWLKAHPDERAADVNRAFADDGVDAVVATMGGNVGLQLLDRLDERTIANNPKRFYGSSDNTHLHLFLNDLGVVSFYGGQLFPDLAADPETHPYTREHVERALRSTPFGEVGAADEWTDEYDDVESDRPRSWFPSDGWLWHWNGADEEPIRAPVLGGCFEMLETQLMLGSSAFSPEALAGCALAVETSGECPEFAELERFFAVLGERGALDGIEALLIGKPETPAEALPERQRFRDRQRDAIVETVDRYADELPIVFDLDFGHAAPVLPLPLGATATIDPIERTVSFREPTSDAE